MCEFSHRPPQSGRIVSEASEQVIAEISNGHISELRTYYYAKDGKMLEVVFKAVAVNEIDKSSPKLSENTLDLSSPKLAE